MKYDLNSCEHWEFLLVANVLPVQPHNNSSYLLGSRNDMFDEDDDEVVRTFKILILMLLDGVLAYYYHLS